MICLILRAFSILKRHRRKRRLAPFSPTDSGMQSMRLLMTPSELTKSNLSRSRSLFVKSIMSPTVRNFVLSVRIFSFFLWNEEFYNFKTSISCRYLLFFKLAPNWEFNADFFGLKLDILLFKYEFINTSWFWPFFCIYSYRPWNYNFHWLRW